VSDRTLFRLWLAGLVLLAWVATVLGTAHLVLQASRRDPSRLDARSSFVLAVANYPHLLAQALRETAGGAVGEPTTLLVSRAAVERPWWVRRFPAPEDPGYLLFSGVDAERKQSAVRLVRIADGAVLGRWDPDWKVLHAKATPKAWSPSFAYTDMRAFHPLLLDDGSIVFNTEESMVRMPACGTSATWVLDALMHHSVEKDADDSVWAPSVSDQPYSDNPWLRAHLRPDALAHVSLDGRLLERRSFADILEANGLRALLLGTSGLRMNEDPIHLNEIVVAPQDGRFWQRGDLLVSARHLSTVFLYRPSTNRILWHRQGPWLNQHAARFLDDHRISVFDNYVFGGAPDDAPFVMQGETNRVLVYDFDTSTVSEPFAALLAAAKPATLTEGRARLLPDGGLFVEDTNNGRLLRFTADRLLWSRVNDFDKTRIGFLSWSRYLTADEAAAPLRALAAGPCAAPAQTH
jgi:hypothetical protein